VDPASRAAATGTAATAVFDDLTLMFISSFYLKMASSRLPIRS
jgi:hypothetical protein